MRDPRGRKSHAKNKQNQELVIDLRGGGMSHADIATVLGCDEKTLRKYYSRELVEGAILIQAQAIRVIMAKMRAGNMTATKQALEISGLQTAPTKPQKSSPLAQPPLGKKEMLAKEAGEVPRGWGDVLGDGGKIN